LAEAAKNSLDPGKEKNQRGFITNPALEALLSSENTRYLPRKHRSDKGKGFVRENGR